MPTGSLVELAEDPRRRAVFAGMRHLLDVRRQHEAFSPFGTQQVEHLDDRVFAVRRGAGTPASCSASPTSRAPRSRCRRWPATTC